LLRRIAALGARAYLVSAREHLTDQLLLPLALAGAASFTAEKHEFVGDCGVSAGAV